MYALIGSGFVIPAHSRCVAIDALTEWDKRKEKPQMLERANSEHTLFRH